MREWRGSTGSQRIVSTNLLQKIIQGLARNGLEGLVTDGTALHAIQPKIAEAVAQIAPGGERPVFAPEKQSGLSLLLQGEN